MTPSGGRSLFLCQHILYGRLLALRQKVNLFTESDEAILVVRAASYLVKRICSCSEGQLGVRDILKVIFEATLSSFPFTGFLSRETLHRKLQIIAHIQILAVIIKCA